jgi:hypothetical protein
VSLGVLTFDEHLGSLPTSRKQKQIGQRGKKAFRPEIFFLSSEVRTYPSRRHKMATTRRIDPSWGAVLLEQERLCENGYKPSLEELENFIGAANEAKRWVQIELDKVDWSCHTEQRLEDDEENRRRLVEIREWIYWATSLMEHMKKTEKKRTEKNGTEKKGTERKGVEKKGKGKGKTKASGK